MRKVKHQEASRTDDWNAKKTQYQEIAEALIQFFIVQAAVYAYTIWKLAEEQEAPSRTSATRSACSPTPELIEAQHVDPRVEELPTEESPEESYIETPKPVETEQPIQPLSSCVQLTPPSLLLKSMPPLYACSALRARPSCAHVP